MKITYCEHCKVLISRAIGVDEVGYPYSMDYGPVWVCPKCDAYVGSHKGTGAPLGTAANAELRQARMEVHRVFDPIWRSGAVSRSKAYTMLSYKMQFMLGNKSAHIGQMNYEQCMVAREIAFELADMLKVPV